MQTTKSETAEQIHVECMANSICSVGSGGHAITTHRQCGSIPLAGCSSQTDSIAEWYNPAKYSDIADCPQGSGRQHKDAGQAAEALHALKESLGMCDGWRLTNGATKEFSYLQASTGSQSRIDRIYVRCGMMKGMDAWNIEEHGVP